MNHCFIKIAFGLAALCGLLLCSSPVSALTGGAIVVDDFNDAYPETNSLGYWTGGIEGVPGYNFLDVDIDYFAGKRVKRIDYAGSDGWFASNLYEGTTFYDISGISETGYLLFWLKRENGNDTFQIQLQDEAWVIQSVPIDTYAVAGTGWQQVSIPLDDFPGLNFTQMRAVAFAFGSNSGTIYVDDIVFHTQDSLDHITGYLVVDDFNDADSSNNSLGYPVSETDSTPGYYFVEEYLDSFSGKRVKRIGYAVGNGSFTSDLYEDVEFCNLSYYSYLLFWIKGEAGGEVFNIELQDSNATVKSVSLDSYAIVSAAWQQVSIPLSAFEGGAPAIDMTQIKDISFAFGSNSGTIYVDDIVFHTAVSFNNIPEPVVIDDYNDNDSTKNSLYYWTGGSGGLAGYYFAEEYLDGFAGVKSKVIEYAGSDGWFALTLYEDTTFYDISDYNCLIFWIKGETGGEDFDIELQDINWTFQNPGPTVSLSDYVAIGTDWQQVSIPLSDFLAIDPGLDITQMRAVVLLFGNNTGKIYIDDVAFHTRDILDHIPGPFVVDNHNDNDNWENTLGYVISSGGQLSSYFKEEYLDGFDGGRVKYIYWSNADAWYASSLYEGRPDPEPDVFSDISDYSHLLFWIKGWVGGEDFDIELQDINWTFQDPGPTVSLSDYAVIGTNWQQVSIPLGDFLAIDTELDITQMRAVTFFTPNLTIASKVYIDDIVFCNKNYLNSILGIPLISIANTYVVDDFNDDWDWLRKDLNLLDFWAGGGGMVGGVEVSPVIEREHLYTMKRNSVYYNINWAKKIDYNCPNQGDWQFYASNLFDDSNPPEPPYTDISDYRDLSFRLKREWDVDESYYACCYIKIRSYITDTIDGETDPLLIRSPDYVEDTAEWQQVIINLDDFTGFLDREKVKSVVFFFDNTLPATKGTLHIDNIQFAKGRTKPVGTANVRIDYATNTLYVDDQPFTVKGVGYQPVSIGDSQLVSWADGVYDRDFPLLRDMGANAIRIWTMRDAGEPGEPGPQLMAKAAEYGLKVIAGFWTPRGVDYSDPYVREEIKVRFTDFVNRYKDEEVLLIWVIGNETTWYWSTTRDYYYSLANELAYIAYTEETRDKPPGEYHPIMISNGHFKWIGDTSKNAEDLQLNYMDLWGANLYARDYNAAGDWFVDENDNPVDLDLFEVYKLMSFFPFVILEYGADAFYTTDPNYPFDGYEDERAQADWVYNNTADILAASDVCLGGTVMEYSDEWCKYRQGYPFLQEYGPAAAWMDLPDGYANEEWWGIVKIAPDGTWSEPDGLDDVRKRQVYYSLKNIFTPRPGACFLAGTPILMADGTSRPIEELKIGDTLLAFDEATGDFMPDKVKHVFVIPGEEEYLIINSHLRVTPHHTFYATTYTPGVSVNGKWIEAGKLKVGDMLMNANSKPEKIASIKHVKDNVTVYNLEVNPYHTFIAGGVVVHNKRLDKRKLLIRRPIIP